MAHAISDEKLPVCPLCKKTFESTMVGVAPDKNLDEDAAEALNVERSRAAENARKKRKRGDGAGAGADDANADADADADRLRQRRRRNDIFADERARITLRSRDDEGYNEFEYSDEYAVNQDVQPTRYDPLWRNSAYFVTRMPTMPGAHYDLYFSRRFINNEHPDRLKYDADTNLYTRFVYDEPSKDFIKQNLLPGLTPEDVHSEEQWILGTAWIRRQEVLAEREQQRQQRASCGIQG